MKNRLLSAIVMTSLALQLVACGASDSAKDVGATEAADAMAEAQAEQKEAEAADTASENTEETAENATIANPWRECTEDEAKAACPRLFKAPEDDLVSSWSMMDSETVSPGPVIQLDFRMDGKDFTARAQYGAAENEDISGIYYDWDVTDDITLANWGGGNMHGKYYRHIEDGWTVDLCTWYDIEIGIAYSLSVEAEDLDGFDLQAIAEQMYNPENEPYTGEDFEEVSQRQAEPFEGQYYAGRGNLSITGHDDGEYLIEVWWGSSASEHSQWVMHGTYDESTQTITYSDCQKDDFVLGDNGEPISDDVAYTNGTGSIKIVDDSTIMWIDDQDHIADDVPMTR